MAVSLGLVNSQGIIRNLPKSRQPPKQRYEYNERDRENDDNNRLEDAHCADLKHTETRCIVGVLLVNCVGWEDEKI